MCIPPFEFTLLLTSQHLVGMPVFNFYLFTLAQESQEHIERCFWKQNGTDSHAKTGFQEAPGQTWKSTPSRKKATGKGKGKGKKDV